ncbi:Nramp family divalent metal transporter [Paraburkholderia susongensis]|uniref:NRAMP (Natural resistance-associated macrophage protein) metal ion transporters n=1 Tax=Paraburkholderia susongensis TaxID=1515439 RepID=A0A1X7M2R6_9BURK|nr:Nramp family divalent metal transporter [Paraburkholderia susongensis]SMG60351.1 NRAMP (natural resistance-associated macrophage protein) metal ion transporters [Paraburkholderia susongensis]
MNESIAQMVVPRTLTDQTRFNVAETLAGRRRGPAAILSFAGPAVVASIAYVDPGNFATNIQAGAKYGYSLLWVVVFANAVAMLFQILSAKLGIVTGRNLAELCRETLPRVVVMAMWLLSEVAAMATDLAEFVGGAIGLSLLLHLSLISAMAVTAVLTYGLLQFERAGFRPLELVIAGLIGVIGLSYVAEMLMTPIAWSALAAGVFVPSRLDNGALLLSVGIVGATVMPHVLFLHSGLTQNRSQPRNDSERQTLLVFSNIVMQGFFGFSIPVWFRRLVTVLPAFVVIGLGVNPTRALIASQVVLSIALPAPMAMVLGFSSNRRLMGHYRNRTPMIVLASLGAGLVMVLNLVLVWQMLA